MMRRLLLVVLIALLGGQCFAAPRFPVTVRDGRNVAVTLRVAPRRIVSLSPGTTEMLFALGLGRAVVGDTVYCDYPPAAKSPHIAKIGDVNTNYERVISLRPDLIVASDANRAAIIRLTALHQPVFVIEPKSFDTVETSLRQLGRITGTSAAAKHVIAQMEAKRREAHAIAAHDRAHRPKVLIVLGVSPLWTAGNDTFPGGIIREAGGINIGASVHGYGTLSKEAVLADPPGYILAGPESARSIRSDPAFRTLAAVRAGRFFHVADDLVSRPGPRLADGLLQVARALHPRTK